MKQYSHSTVVTYPGPMGTSNRHDAAVRALLASIVSDKGQVESCTSMVTSDRGGNIESYVTFVCYARELETKETK